VKKKDIKSKDFLILVDKKDKEIGVEEKLAAHKKGLLHRAFSIFIFNSKKEVLLQKRSAMKYHSPSVWTNTCCSHPRPGESLKESVHRRLQEEMGFNVCSLKKTCEFVYKKVFENGLTEYEYDHVFCGTFDGIPKINKKEVEDYKWMNIEDLTIDIKTDPQRYSYWLSCVVKNNLEDILKDI
jgi:isopentenyl-diphosphate Delta-isomerase